MRRKLGMILGITGAILFLLAMMRLVIGRPPKEGMLKVMSAPAGTVFLDNKKIGKTPLDYKTATGEYTLQVVPDGSNPQLTSWQGTITVSPNALTYVNRDLSGSDLAMGGEILTLESNKKRAASVIVTTTPDGATVLLDDEEKGQSPLEIESVTPGDHSITVASPGFETRTIKMKATTGYTLRIVVQLALAPAVIGLEAPLASQSATPTSGPIIASVTPKSGGDTGLQKPYVVIKDTPTGFLRVRLEPSTAASVAAEVKPSETYPWVSSKDGWHEIRYDGVHTGWVSGQYIEKVD